jgi:hypothetical protein
VTSFHEEAYSYAKDCLSTLEKHFPGKIVAYIEGGSYDHPKVEFRDFWAINGVKDYLEKLKRHPGGDGVLNGKYDFRYDANKFCRKVFAQDAVFDEDQYVFWFDADCIVKKPIPEPLLVSLVEKPFAYLGRKVPIPTPRQGGWASTPSTETSRLLEASTSVLHYRSDLLSVERLARLHRF